MKGTLLLGRMEVGHVVHSPETSQGATMSRILTAELKKCGNRKDLHQGKLLHASAIESGCHKNTYVATALVSMYAKCGCMEDARDAFENMIQRDVVSWSIMILGYVENGESSLGLDVFNSMECAPDKFTFVAALKACASLAAEDKKASLENGMRIHREAGERGFHKDIFVENTLIDMYSKCGCMVQARDVFESMFRHDVVSWTALILGYVENGESSVALELFNRMDCAPNRVTFVGVLKACGNLGAVETGEKIHDRVRMLGLERNQMVATSLVDFYGKCGNMDAARDVFDRMQVKDIVCWNALIGGYCLVGDASQVFTLVKKIQMDSVTMLLVLTTCTHAGMVEESLKYLESLSRYGIVPTAEHYTCVVGILGRVNRLQEALSLARRMPFEGGSVWMTLLGACMKWSNLEIGKAAFHAVVRENDKEQVAAAYVLVGNIYEKLGMEKEAEYIQTERTKTRDRTKAGRTWWCDAEGKVVHRFVWEENLKVKVVEKLEHVLMDYGT